MSLSLSLDGMKCVVFDFAGTLSSDFYFRELGAEQLALVEDQLFGQDKTVVDHWMSGNWSSLQVAQWLSPRIQVDPTTIDTALRRGCTKMVFNTEVVDFAIHLRETGTKTALVTINADVFTEVVVPAHNLQSVFDVIVNSSVEKHRDKKRLWEKAFAQLNENIGFHNSLLIDDSEEMIALYREAGGRAHHFQSAVLSSANVLRQLG